MAEEREVSTRGRKERRGGREKKTRGQRETPTRGPTDLPTQGMVDSGRGEETVWTLSADDQTFCLSVPWLPNDGMRRLQKHSEERSLIIRSEVSSWDALETAGSKAE